MELEIAPPVGAETTPAQEPDQPVADTAPVGNRPPPANAVKVDGAHRRSDNDALEGAFATVIAGEHAGRHGVFDWVLEYGDDGYPAKVMLLTRDDRNEHLEVAYSDLRPASEGRR